MAAPITVIAGDRDLTRRHRGLVASNVDPGGFETCQLNPDDIRGLRPGARVTVRYGLEVLWDGRLNEPGNHSKNGVDEHDLAALGYGAALSDNPYQEIYVDRDLTRWRGASVQRKINDIANHNIVDGQTTPDATTGAPSLEQTFPTAPWTAAPGLPAVESFYDAGAGLAIGSLYYAWKKNANVNAGDANWQWDALLSSDDVFTSFDQTGSLRAAGPGTGTLGATAADRRFAAIRHFYQAAGGTGNVGYSIFWTALAVIGRHALPLRGTADATNAQGFYPSDVAKDALARAHAGFAIGVVQDAAIYIVPHLIYPTPTAPQKVIDDMAKLVGWHWGVWEPTTELDTAPTFHFRAPPQEATCYVSRADCQELDEPKVRLDLLYDTAQIAYRDPAGSAGIATVTLANPLLAESGIGSRTLSIDMGLGSATTAAAFGQFALLLAQRTARGGGSCLLPDSVSLPTGGTRPSCLLKAGRDRLRIIDLQDPGPLTESDTRRFDTFHVRRVETTIDEHGVLQTRCEFDGGADLMEVLQAQLQIAAVLAGSGG